MPTIEQFEVMAVNLPFRVSFKHAAAKRRVSNSIFLRCRTESGVIGFGESLPRAYVTGETQESAISLLRDRILPRLIGKSFDTLDEVLSFLTTCDGKAPESWVPATEPQGAAWAAVDLALLDTIGKATEMPVRINENRAFPPGLRYSGVQSSQSGLLFFLILLTYRFYGIRQLKLKVEGTGSLKAARWVKRILGSTADIRADVNMAWSVAEAIETMPQLAAYGIRMFEQPIAATDLAGLAKVTQATGLGVMADESLSDRTSLQQLIEQTACTAVNVRISKCGGLVASYNRCQEAIAAGLILQVGCQVGESSLSSAAHLLLLSAVQKVTYAEGCFGQRLLNRDPASSLLEFGYGGQAPALPTGPGLGITIDETVLQKATTQTYLIS